MTTKERAAWLWKALFLDGVSHQQTALEEAIDAAMAEEREACADICERMRPHGGRAWTYEQRACYEALSDAAKNIRSRAPAPERPCVRCGAPYAPTGSCSRAKEGCQGGRGEDVPWKPAPVDPVREADDSVGGMPHLDLPDRKPPGAEPGLVRKLRDALRERDEARAERDALKVVFREAKNVAALKYEVTHKGKGPPSDYDPDIYQLEKVTDAGWWRFVHAVRDAEKALATPKTEEGGK